MARGQDGMGIFSKFPSYLGALYPDLSETNYIPDYRGDLTATSKLWFDAGRIIPTGKDVSIINYCITFCIRVL